MDETIADVMADAVRGLDVPTDLLVTGGLLRGRRRRRMRHAAEATTAAVVVLALVALALVAVPDGRTTHGAAGSPTVAVSPSSVSPSSASPSSSSASIEPATVVMTPQALLRTTLDLLPRAGTTSGYQGVSLLGNASAGFVYDDGHGVAEVSVSLDYPLSGGPLESPCNEITACTHRPDGTTIAVYQGNAHPGHPEYPGKDWEITALRPDGIAVRISEWNSSNGKGADVTRPRPPFTVDEVIAIVIDDAYAARITQERADAAASLFVPGPDPGDGTGAAGPSK